MRRAALLAAVLLAGCGGDTTATRQDAGLRLVKLGTFQRPVYLTSPPGDATHRYVVEQRGVVRLLGADRPFLDISDRVTEGSEQGLLSLAFAPDYATSKRFYVYFTNKQSKEEIDSFTASSPQTADAGSARSVLVMDDPESNHNGGLLLFGPDGHMYVGTGDGGGAGDQHGALGNAQDKRSLLGKLLRIDPRAGGYDVPRDNPFGNEVFAYGLRNPWRYSFDGRTLIIGDVGQDKYEEIDAVGLDRARGANFGWRPFEGLHVYARGESAPGAIKPVIEQAHADGNCSITGGVVAHDPDVPGAEGKYLFGDYCKGEVYTAHVADGRASDVRPTGLKVQGLSSFGVDADRHVYLISNNGPVYQLKAGT